jgi:SNF family Na+-dependent transporter
VQGTVENEVEKEGIEEGIEKEIQILITYLYTCLLVNTIILIFINGENGVLTLKKILEFLKSHIWYVFIWVKKRPKSLPNYVEYVI